MITEQEILDLDFVKDEELSTDEITKYVYEIKRPDLNPLYTYSRYTIYYDLVDGIIDLVGTIEHNKIRAHNTYRYTGTPDDISELEKYFKGFLFKELKGTKFLRDLYGK